MNYGILIKDEEQCIRVQKKLFEGNIGWICSGKEITHKSDRILTVYKEYGGVPVIDASWNEDIYVWVENWKKLGPYKLITAEEFLENPNIIPFFNKKIITVRVWDTHNIELDDNCIAKIELTQHGGIDASEYYNDDGEEIIIDGKNYWITIN